MILAVDADYATDSAWIAGVAFQAWPDAVATATYRTQVSPIEEYESGEFFKRELPCILQLLDEFALTPDVIIIDGFVYLDGKTKPGMGAYLHQALDENVPVIGVAKRPFKGIDDRYSLLRGDSQNPIYVTSVGMPQSYARKAVEDMHGKYRIPTLLKLADQVCRGHHE